METGLLLGYLEGFGHLSVDSKQKISELVEIESLERGDVLWKAGERCDKVYFINSGLVRLYFYNEKGEEITVHFIGPKKFLADIESQNTGAPSSVTASVEIATRLITFKQSAWQKLEKEIFEWSSIVRKITEKSLFDKVKMRNELFQHEAKERYRLFLTYFPSVANQVKASHVASFLGISQYTLSHIKKELVTVDFLRNSKN